MSIRSEQVSHVGLTAAEAEARRRRGEANTAVSGGSRSYATILRTNVFSFYNSILFVIGIALLALGRYSDALVSVGLGLINAVISAVQEIRAKRKLDQLQLLGHTPVQVLRDGREVELAPNAVVRGDVLVLRPGGQIVVDGPLLDGHVEADESLLTGESEPVVKDVGDDLRSGSLCVAGSGHQLARDVGADSYAGRLTAEARRATTDKTPLQRSIEFVVRLVIALTVLMSGVIGPRPCWRASPCCGSCRSPPCCRGWCRTACSSSSRSPTPSAPPPSPAKAP
jgi:cation-transporting P-type ATPase E